MVLPFFPNQHKPGFDFLRRWVHELLWTGSRFELVLRPVARLEAALVKQSTKTNVQCRVKPIFCCRDDSDLNALNPLYAYRFSHY